jgi:hypothetical protein
LALTDPAADGPAQIPISVSVKRLGKIPLRQFERVLHAHDRVASGRLQTFEAFVTLVGETCRENDHEVDLSVPVWFRYEDPARGVGIRGQAESSPRKILIRFNEYAGAADWVEVLAEEWRHIGQYQREEEACSGEAGCGCERCDAPQPDYRDDPAEHAAKDFAMKICSFLTGSLA